MNIDELRENLYFFIELAISEARKNNSLAITKDVIKILQNQIKIEIEIAKLRRKEDKSNLDRLNEILNNILDD
ncbi:hypothetical protein HRbin04_00500 [archaeon HR04]|nr:hypothetical protein HRbin04_00500 [archaeon HR04]